MSGIFAGNGAAVATVADAESGWSGFHGLPVIDGLWVPVMQVRLVTEEDGWSADLAVAPTPQDATRSGTRARVTE